MWVLATGLVTVIAAMSVPTSSAVASESGCTKGVENGVVVLCANGARQLSEVPFVVSGRSGLKALEIERAGFATLKCSSVTGSGTFVASGNALAAKKLKATYSGCIDPTEEAACEIKPIKVDGESGSGLGPGLEGTFTSAEALGLTGPKTSSLTTLVISSKPGKSCELAGEYPLKGILTDSLAGGVEAVQHTLTDRGSSIRGWGTDRLWENLNVELASHQAWSVLG
jgi:hypothetical protein